MQRLWGAVVLGAVLLVGAAPAATAGEGDLTIRIDAGGNVTLSDPEGLVENASADPPDRYAWTLNLTRGDTASGIENYTTAEVLIEKGFPVDRAAQMVPLLDGEHFVRAGGSNVSDVDRPAKVYNRTEEASAYRYGLGLPGPGLAELVLERDIEAPTLTVESVTNVTDIGFDVKTNTSEPANAELSVYEDSEQIQSYPTPHPGVFQVFPVQGLDANTTYEIEVTAEDWSGNNATAERQQVTTAPAPNPPEPIVTPISPEPDTTISPNEVVVQASFEPNGSTIADDGIRLFFDKERVDRETFQVEGDTLTYRPEGTLGERTYFVAVEVDNQAGGTGVAQWSFDVQVPQSTSSPLTAGLVVLGLAAVAVLGRRSSQ